MEEMELVSLLQSVLLRILDKRKENGNLNKHDNLNKSHDVVINANAGRERSRNT